MRVFLLLAFLLPALASGAELRDLYRGIRETGMGGVSAAVTEGDEAIYLNPAAMAANKGIKFYLLEADLGISTDTVGEARTATTTFKNISPSNLNQLMGKNIFLQGTLTSSVTLPNFGMSALLDEQLAFLLQNQAAPNAMFGLQTTSGFQFATGFSVLPKRRRTVDELNVGVGFKFMFRRGGYNTLTTQQLLNISQTEIKNITGNFGSGIAGDLGLQYGRALSKSVKLLAGLSYQDMGGLAFKGGGQLQPEDLGFGIGSKIQVGRSMKLTVGYDAKNLTQDVEWAKRNHIGFDLALLDLDLYGGFNEGRYLSGGAAIDFWLLKISAVTYEEELGEFSGQMGERRYMLRITFKF